MFSLYIINSPVTLDYKIKRDVYGKLKCIII